MWLKHNSLQIFHHVIFTWKYFYLFRGNTCWSQKIYYLSSSPHLRRSQAKKICWITHKNIQQFSQRNSWKEMRTFWCRKEDYIFGKTLSLISNSTTFLWHIKIHSMHIRTWPSRKLYLPTVCLTNFWLWFFFIISIWIRRQVR